MPSERLAERDEDRVGYWARRLLHANYRNEPVYMTPAEFQEVKDIETQRQREWDASFEFRPDQGVIGSPFGTPVIVDEAKRNEQVEAMG